MNIKSFYKLTTLPLKIKSLASSLPKTLTSVFVWGFSVIYLSFSISHLSHAQQNAYILGANDIIGISVYEEEDLSFEEIRIADTGILTFPFIGEVQASGNSLTSLESLIRIALIEGEFLINPKVTVGIVEYRPFYIDGEVEEPGSYPYEPGLTPRKAVTIAGGFTERASRNKITLLPANSEPNEEPSQIDSLDISINPGDIITVEERFF